MNLSARKAPLAVSLYECLAGKDLLERIVMCERRAVSRRLVGRTFRTLAFGFNGSNGILRIGYVLFALSEARSESLKNQQSLHSDRLSGLRQ